MISSSMSTTKIRRGGYSGNQKTRQDPAARNLKYSGGDRHHIKITQITTSSQLIIMKGKFRKLEEHKLRELL